MTLTDIMPTLRMSIPDPIDLAAWPPGTSVTIDDVVLEQLSMLAVSRLLSTPCTWTTAQASLSGADTALMCTVTAVLHDGEGTIALVDGDVRGSGAAWAHARLIGRVSVAYKEPVRLLGDGSRVEHVCATATPAARDSRGVAVSLPRDLAVGDVIVVPCAPVPPPPARSARPCASAHLTPA